MNKHKSQILMSAAIAGLIGAGSALTSAVAQAADDSAKGHCMGANSCKGTGGCSQTGKNDCAGKNGCGGKGFLEMTEKDCKAKKAEFEAKAKGIKWEAAAKKSEG